MNSMSPGRKPIKSGSRSTTAVEQTTYNNMSETTVIKPSLSALPRSPSPRIHSRPEQQAMAGGMPHDELHWMQIGSGAWVRTFTTLRHLCCLRRAGRATPTSNDG